jgi:hypothetical protein
MVDIDYMLSVPVRSLPRYWRDSSILSPTNL